MRLIQIEASKLGARLFRNNVGLAHAPDGSVIRYGLCVGSADLIGWTSGGRFLAVEVKTATGRVSDAQKAWLAAAQGSGCLAGVCRDVQEFRLLLKQGLE